MGLYAEYLDRQMNFAQLVAERKSQLNRIADIRGRDVLSFAANLMNNRQPIAINYSDLLPFADLRAMRLRITDYSGQEELCDAIRRYYTLLQMTFSSNVFKIFETPTSQVMRFEAIQNVSLPGLGGGPAAPGQQPQAVEIGVACGKCQAQIKVHAPFEGGAPVPIGAVPFPADNRIRVSQVRHRARLNRRTPAN